MRRLIIETAGPACSVALFDGARLLVHAHEQVGRGHAERLVPMIAELGEIVADEIVVDCGPGSFTGMRVGLSAAIGLGIGWRVPVRGFSSLALVAAVAEATVGTGDVLVVNEGGHGQVFVQRFGLRPLRLLGPAASLDPQQVTSTGATLAGTAGARFAALLPVELDAREVMLLPAALRMQQPTPFYGRGADAKPMAH